VPAPCLLQKQAAAPGFVIIFFSFVVSFKN
jgi:hypothetical protein